MFGTFLALTLKYFFLNIKKSFKYSIQFNIKTEKVIYIVHTVLYITPEL